MTQPITSEERKRRVQANFDALAAEYDGLRFVRECARRLIELATTDPGALYLGARVLDIATGTGLVALATAQVVGRAGTVMGVDISPRMLARARDKLATTGLNQVDFTLGDTEHLDFPAGSFDAVLCASSLFFVPDMHGALREWRRVLIPGGWAGFSSFGPSFLKPVNDLLAATLRLHGVPVAVTPNPRLEDVHICEQLLRLAGFEQVQVRTEQLGYFLSPEQRWDEIMAGLDGMPLSRLAPDIREQIKREHLEQLQAVATSEGIWVDVAANFAFGRNPI